MVVSVVVRDRKEGAGEENVLPAPLPELTPQPTVALVACPDDGACEGAASECAPCSVDIMVGATDLLPIVGGWRPSEEERSDRLRSTEDVLTESPVGTVENERLPAGMPPFPFAMPDSGYGWFFERVCFFDADLVW